jgi:hypothetical protein
VSGEKHVCPLKFGGQNEYAQDCFCEEGMCAWWDNRHDCCAVVGVAVALDQPLNVYAKED